MGEQTPLGWTCPHCFRHIKWEHTPYVERQEFDRRTALARELYEAGKALHAQAIDAGVRHLDPTLLDVNLALARYEQEVGE